MATSITLGLTSGGEAQIYDSAGQYTFTPKSGDTIYYWDGAFSGSGTQLPAVGWTKTVGGSNSDDVHFHNSQTASGDPDVTLTLTKSGDK